MISRGQVDSCCFYMQEIKDTLDKEAVYRCMGSCYEMSQPDRPKLDIGGMKPAGPMSLSMKLQSAKNIAKLGTQMLASKLVSFQLIIWTSK